MRNPLKDIPVFHQHLSELVELVDETLSESMDWNDEDHFGFMACCFIGKQLEHARAVQCLISANHEIGASVIARTMVEGLVLLAWASLKPQERAFRWRSYSLVTDWRTNLQKKDAGEPIDKVQLAVIKEMLQEYGDPFLTKKARQNGGMDAFDDPFQRTWMVDENGSSTTITSAAEQAGGRDLVSLYSTMSQVGHWTPAGIGDSITHTTKGVSLSFKSDGHAAQSLAAAFQGLHGVFKLFCQHFKVQALSELEKIRNLYVQASSQNT